MYLVEHAVGEDGLLVEHLHGDSGAGLGVDGELDLGEGALPDGAPHLVPPHPLLPRRRARHSSGLSWRPSPRILAGVCARAGLGLEGEAGDGGFACCAAGLAGRSLASSTL